MIQWLLTPGRIDGTPRSQPIRTKPKKVDLRKKKVMTLREADSMAQRRFNAFLAAVSAEEEIVAL
jgi:hypothetical protein